MWGLNLFGEQRLVFVRQFHREVSFNLLNVSFNCFPHRCDVVLDKLLLFDLFALDARDLLPLL